MPSSLETMLCLRQREIAGCLGYPEEESVVRILRKIPAASLDLERLKALRPVLRRTVARELLAHVPRLNAGVQALVADVSLIEFVTPGLLAGVAADDAEETQPQAATMLRVVRDLWHRLERRGTPRPFDSLARLQRVQNELTAELARRTELGFLGEPLPPPPLPGHRDIEPLTTAAMLIEEGGAQHNCVAGYGSLVRRGEQYIYRVLKPQRATLAIAKGAHGDWEIAQIKLACNKQPATPTVEAVNAWLRLYALSV